MTRLDVSFRLVIRFATLLVLTAFAAKVDACECASGRPLCQSYFQVDAVFVGTVRSISDDEGTPDSPYRRRLVLFNRVSLRRTIEPSIVYPRTFYPGTSSRSGAAVVDSGEGNHQQLDPFRLPRAGQSHEPGGRLLRAGGQPVGDRIVQQLRELPTPLPANPRPDDPVEQRRRQLYQELRQLGNDALPALARGLSDTDVSMRKNVALAVNVLAGGWFARSEPRIDIRPILPAVIAALKDSDISVRAWSAQAIGEVGPDAVQAVPALITLLSLDEGSSTSACTALRRIGPGAKDALPALRKALSDPSPNVRRLAQRAIETIQAR